MGVGYCGSLCLRRRTLSVGGGCLRLCFLFIEVCSLQSCVTLVYLPTHGEVFCGSGPYSWVGEEGERRYDSGLYPRSVCL